MDTAVVDRVSSIPYATRLEPERGREGRGLMLFFGVVWLFWGAALPVIVGWAWVSGSSMFKRDGGAMWMASLIDVCVQLAVEAALWMLLGVGMIGMKRWALPLAVALCTGALISKVAGVPGSVLGVVLNNPPVRSMLFDLMYWALTTAFVASCLWFCLRPRTRGLVDTTDIAPAWTDRWPMATVVMAYVAALAMLNLVGGLVVMVMGLESGVRFWPWLLVAIPVSGGLAVLYGFVVLECLANVSRAGWLMKWCWMGSGVFSFVTQIVTPEVSMESLLLIRSTQTPLLVSLLNIVCATGLGLWLLDRFDPASATRKRV